MMRTLYTVVIGAALVPAVRADEKGPAGGNPAPMVLGQTEVQPRATTARFNDKRELVVKLQNPVPRTVTINVLVGGKVEQQTMTVYEMGTRDQVIDLDGLQVQQADGKKIDPKALAERLKKEGPVLVAWQGTTVPPVFLKVIKDDTLILFLPARYAVHLAPVAEPTPAKPPAPKP